MKKAGRFIRPRLRSKPRKPLEIEGPKSRSQLKREMTALQELGKRISELPAERLKALGLPSELEEAVLLVRTFKSREARRRQVQYVGALMRRVDCEPIRQAYQDLSQIGGREIRAFQEIERWRDELLRGNDGILDEIAGRFPSMDRQHCLSLVQEARHEQASGGKKGSRTLFRYLKKVSDGAEPEAGE